MKPHSNRPFWLNVYSRDLLPGKWLLVRQKHYSRISADDAARRTKAWFDYRRLYCIKVIPK